MCSPGIHYSPPFSLCRQRRIAEMMATQQKAKFGSVKEISAVDYVGEVNKAGDDIWVVLHLYKSGYPCMLNHMTYVHRLDKLLITLYL